MAVPLDGLTAAIDELCDSDPSVLADGETLVALLSQVERLSAVATRAVARFDAGGEWAADGARSAAAWISTRCRSPKRAVRRQIGLGRALRQMPGTEAAWLDGAVGEAQVAALRRAAATCAKAFDRDESVLVGKATELQHRHFEQKIAAWRQEVAPDDTEQEAESDYQARRAHLSGGMRGTGFLDAMFDPLGYAVFDKALRAIEQELFEADWAEARSRLGDTVSVHDLRRTPAQRRHDALVEMARRSLAMPPGGRLPDPLFTVVLGDEAARRLCRLANGTVVTPGSLIRWLDDAWLERFVTGLPDRKLNLSVRRRLFTGGTRRAVELQHTECYHPYCDTPIEQCEIDHIEPYAAGGLTVDWNGRPAGAFHNRLRNRRVDDEPEPPPPPRPHDQPPPESPDWDHGAAGADAGGPRPRSP